MGTLDWTIVTAYLILPFAVSFWFARRAGKSAESFLMAGRNLPWWIIGFSAAATYTSSGSATAFSMLVYDRGVGGN